MNKYTSEQLKLDGYRRSKYINELEDSDRLEDAMRSNRNDLVSYVDQKNKNSITYDELARLQTWVLSRFHYSTDEGDFEKSDYWDTLAWKKILVYGDLHNDCDHAGYAILGLLYYVFHIPKERLYRVSCAAETGEGHFVAWVKSDPEGVIYQLENRVRVPRSLRYMHDLGYKYWHYSPMTITDKWYDAEKKVMEIVYNTPSDLRSDKPIFTFKKAVAVDKSDTLKIGWVQIIAGFVSTILPWLQDNEGYLERVISTESVGILMILLGFMAVFLRTVTHQDIEMKKDEDAKLHKS